MAELVTIARPYAKAAFQLAKERGDVDAWGQVMGLLSGLSKHEEAKVILHAENSKDTVAFIDGLVSKSGAIPNGFSDFLNLLAQKKRLVVLPELAKLFIGYYNEDNNLAFATITSAKPLSDAELDSLVAGLERKFGKKVQAETRIDETLIGGAVIETSGIIIDGSIKGKLAELAKSLN